MAISDLKEIRCRYCGKYALNKGRDMVADIPVKLREYGDVEVSAIVWVCECAGCGKDNFILYSIG